jgi:hypothetical protein
MIQSEHLSVDVFAPANQFPKLDMMDWRNSNLSIAKDNISIEVASPYCLAKIVLHAESSSAVDEGCDSAR